MKNATLGTWFANFLILEWNDNFIYTIIFYDITYKFEIKCILNLIWIFFQIFMIILNFHKKIWIFAWFIENMWFHLSQENSGRDIREMWLEDTGRRRENYCTVVIDYYSREQRLWYYRMWQVNRRCDITECDIKEACVTYSNSNAWQLDHQARALF